MGKMSEEFLFNLILRAGFPLLFVASTNEVMCYEKFLLNVLLILTCSNSLVVFCFFFFSKMFLVMPHRLFF